MTENLVFNIHRKISKTGPGTPVVGKFCKRCSDSVFNHLTLWIEPFGEFRKKNHFCPGACPGMPNTFKAWYLENRSTDFAHFCRGYSAQWYLSEYAVSKVAGTPISRKKPKYGQNLFSWIINEPEFFRTNGRARFGPLLCRTFMQKS